MQLETVTSSVIHAIGYDRENRVLEIIFNSGRIYQFTGVPEEQYEALRRAESKGRYFGENIRDVFPYWSFHLPRQQKRRVGQGASNE